MKTNNTEALGTAPVGPLLLKLSIPAIAGIESFNNSGPTGAVPRASVLFVFT